MFITSEKATVLRSPASFANGSWVLRPWDFSNVKFRHQVCLSFSTHTVTHKTQESAKIRQRLNTPNRAESFGGR
jgi:hypothetical protein